MANSGKRGSIRQVANGTWGFVVDVGEDAHGKRQQTRRRGFRTKRDAAAALDEILGQFHSQTYVAPKRQTLRQYLLEDWLTAIKPTVRLSTWQSYERTLRYHVASRQIGGLQLQQVDGPALNRLYGEMAQAGGARWGRTLSPRTIAFTHAVLHRAFKDAVRWQRLIRNPCDQADPPSSGQRKPMSFWGADQLSDFLLSVREDRLFALWLMYATTGMRRGEALGVAWDHLALDAAEPRLSLARQLTPNWAERQNRGWQFGPPKTAAGARTISLDPLTVTVLRQHRVRQNGERLLIGSRWRVGAPPEVTMDGGLVFCGSGGMPLEPAWTSSEFVRLVKAAGLPRITLHGLRHSWATLALKAGEHPKVVQERLGHGSIAITLNMYSHVVAGMDAAAASRVAALLNVPLVDLPIVDPARPAGGAS